jgi:hypothetical protein
LEFPFLQSEGLLVSDSLLEIGEFVVLEDAKHLWACEPVNYHAPEHMNGFIVQGFVDHFRATLYSYVTGKGGKFCYVVGHGGGSFGVISFLTTPITQDILTVNTNLWPWKK